MAARSDQPSNVATEDALRPPDSAVVTSDTPAVAEPSGNESDKPAAGDKPDASNDSTSAASENDKPKPRKTNTENRRFRKLSKRLGQVEEADKAKARRINELENQVETLKATPPEKAPEPKLKDFDTPQEYAKAYAKWSKPAKPKATKPDPAKPPASDADSLEDEDIAAFNKLGKEKLGDEFLEATQDNENSCNFVMGEYMLDHELGPEIYVHLSNNHEEARKIYDMRPHNAVKALDALAAKGEKGELDVGDDGDMKVADPPDTGDPDNEPKKTPAGSGGKRPGTTKAPEPPSDTKGGTATPKKSLEDMDMEEYSATRTAQERKRKGLPPI